MSEILQEKEKLSSLAHTHILDVINASERESKERAVFVAALNEVNPPEGVPENDAKEFSLRREGALRHIDTLLYRKARRSPEEYNDDSRLTNRLFEAVRERLIVFRSVEDFFSFESIFTFKFHRFPQMVSYYTKRGEILEVMELADQAHIQGLTRFSMTDDFTVNIQIQVLRLYRYDRNQEAQAQGGDDESSYDIPLEVRTAFSGFFDEPTEDEHHFYDDDISRLLPDGDHVNELKVRS